MNTLVNNFTALASPRNSNGSNNRRASFGFESDLVSSERAQQSHAMVSTDHDNRSDIHLNTGHVNSRGGSATATTTVIPSATNTADARSYASTPSQNDGSGVHLSSRRFGSVRSRRRRSNKCKGLSLNMSVIEDDSRNGTVPPPAGDSTRSMQAACDMACSRITSAIFVGGSRVARDKHVLLQSGITHVLNCAGVSCEDYFPSDFKYRTLMLRDTGREDITPYLNCALEFILMAIQSGGKVFVHCVKGISRSPAVTIAYLMWHDNMTLENAHARMKLARPISDPNAGFIFQLREWADALPSRVLSMGRTLIYHITGPPRFSITDRTGGNVRALVASVGPLEKLPLGLLEDAGHLTPCGAGDDFRGSDSGRSLSQKRGIQKSSKRGVGSTDMPDLRQHSHQCFIVCTLETMWMWHVKECPLELLEMAGLAARQVQVMSGHSQFVQRMVQGQEDHSFREALSCAVGLGGGWEGLNGPQSPDVAMSEADN